ncbi:MAG: UDP-N-acetylglucosamine 2-epimerase (non-hydrolyzing) [Candidatus Eremiobacteraeota bacterium]|nr:UDP-N-acetylglucosamine 2-epimerase (non-hydrolyzing) [Candidatus Eremiobacteraeota bacterium]MBC5803370.1 UDP-N-acetylglucosamine 2-epimerase (non-hydrolyzing) [Candidatus Eremiobacteraeota bacterium]
MAVFGTRPDTIKMAPVVAALRAAGPAIAPLVCVSAQHREMLDDFLALFGIVPDYDLDVMRHDQTVTEITTRVLQGMDGVLARARPDVVLVHGDTSTSTAAALAAYYAKTPVGHVEAGLRTSTIWEPFPEEMNRRLTGRLASFHFAPTPRARRNLEAENVAPADIFVTGNTVIDAFLSVAAAPPAVDVPAWRGLTPDRPWIFVTAHRRENHDRMPEICRALARIAAFPQQPQVLWPLHPSPRVAPVAHALLDGVPGVALVDPLPYDLTVQSIKRSTLVLTDSGGLQEEAPCLGKPVLVMRDETERPEGIEAGTLELVGPHGDAIVAATARLLSDEIAYARMSHANNPYGDGRAAGRIVAWLLARLGDAPYPAEFAVTQA